MNNQEFYLSDAIEVIEEILESGGEFRLYPRGTSMLPLIVQSRDSVSLLRAPAQKGDIAFYRRRDGHFVLHRVMDVCADGTYVMCGDNQTLLERGIRSEQILARVCAVYRREKRIEVDSRAYRTYVFLWARMPLRRVLLFVYRAFAKLSRIFRRILRRSS